MKKNNFLSNFKTKIHNDRKIFLISLIFFISTFGFSLIYPKYSDSTIHIIRARYILNNFSFPFAEFSFNQAKAYVYPPIFHILGATAKYITGFYTVIPALSGSVSIYLTYKLVDLWYDKQTALLAALGVAFMPFFFLWSARMYIGTTITAGFLLTFYLYFLYRDTSEKKYLYSAFIVGGALGAVKTYGPLTVGIISLHLAFDRKIWASNKKILEFVKETYVPAIFSFIAFLPWAVRNLIKTGSPIPKITGRPFKSLGAPKEGLNLFIPSPLEFSWFTQHALGVLPLGTIQQLSRIHVILSYLWHLLPVSLFGFLVYGAYEERKNIFVWIWLSSITGLYFLGRILSGGTFRFKFRHFSTVVPLLGLFGARAYQKIDLKYLNKKLVAVIIVLALFLQMFFAAGISIAYDNATWSPLVSYGQENFEEDEIIYTPSIARQVAYKFDHKYKVIADSKKPGYVDPDEDFISEVRSKSNWILLRKEKDPDSYRAKLERASSRGIVELDKKLIANKNLPLVGEFGEIWYIYRVKE